MTFFNFTERRKRKKENFTKQRDLLFEKNYLYGF